MAYINNLLILFLWTFCLFILIHKASVDPDWLYIQNYYTKQANKEIEKNSKKEESEARKDITAIPAIFNGRLYYPLNGYLYAVNPMGGIVIWEKNLQELSGISPTGLVANANGTVSVVTPIVACHLLIVGIYGPAVVVAVKISTGELVWTTRLSSHLASVVAMSGVFHRGFFYVGTSSLEERVPAGQCCTFRGSFSKLNASTGAVLWQTYMLPDNANKPEGYAGAALWGSNPAIDESRNQIYVATGNLYSAPLHIHRCQQEINNKTARHSYFPDRCVEPENHSNSILALDLDTGKVKWSRRLWGCGDVGFLRCGDHSDSSPKNPEDSHYHEPPIMLTVFHVNQTTKRDAIIANHKSGFAWALDRDNGDLIRFKEPTDPKAYLADHGLH